MKKLIKKGQDGMSIFLNPGTENRDIWSNNNNFIYTDNTYGSTSKDIEKIKQFIGNYFQQQRNLYKEQEIKQALAQQRQQQNQMIGNLTANAMQIFQNVTTPSYDYINSNDIAAKSGRTAVAQTLTTIDPLLGAGYAALDAANNLGVPIFSNATKGNSNLNQNYTTNKAEDIGNTFAALMPLSKLFQKDLGKFNLNNQWSESSGYTGSVALGQNQKENTGAIFGATKLQNGREKAIKEQNLGLNILSNAESRFDIANYSSDLSSEREANRVRGLRIGYFGKNGTKLFTKDQIDLAKKLSIPVKEEQVEVKKEIEQFEEGGKITSTPNVIPEGALHARLHHMEDVDELTRKGIPVVVESEGGELEQQAEIERNEIIFNKEVTEKLEHFYKIYSSDSFTQKEKDEAAIDAGKLLALEIIENTTDRTGLMQTIE